MAFPQLALDQVKGPKATIKTSLGDISLQLFPDQAPKTVKNFVELAKQGYYNDVTFHRVIPDFMVQTGDPTATGAGGESIYGHPFADEFSPELFNLKGAVSMANAGPNTNGSQFFIVTNRNLSTNLLGQMEAAGYPAEVIEAYQNGGTPWLDFHHTVFGQVVSGLDVAIKISQVKRNFEDRPEEDVLIKAIEITE
ncbi:peptidylprolyl isomerase [Limosilactobacillus ingluviei]|uniref:Peptidyl-prolyl cis-trans isomerase n=1 Tax=Limosilactobacillus ingluviei DSM 15946 TaxID=1423760 RepID=A0A0R1UF64_9LACO|nr:peptidylprolyl isomerase [Limosilactobacillus ingluviei]KRL92065.1 peptidyl-prolyl cis-trans isomerase [Limosilactobacillus ingluviei DSM 15946]